ncbi:hypothetical protein THASP1DRAFT_30444 [Thamnocephalis sphaerospora]|uniref:Mechanosensitive ion channel MscS domain-containing protein n=1 Tax=Thamnocephalis sphaerospora TaxID=78915 RepID=A0A4P9XP44_9FUNG|nr:hypothetical protein THASP1DRAFT_30444 [Thamnocephalis sphaerospora]|eukprot:RKP07738.1 hypothetical protein THASP1DRAFT_30444 [Thamnocephalis sphaerospora]
MEWYLSLTLFCTAIIAAIIVHATIFLVLTLLAERTSTLWDDVIVAYSKWPLLPILPLAAALIALPPLFPDMDPRLRGVLQKILGIFLIISAYWLLSSLSRGAYQRYLHQKQQQQYSNGRPLTPRELSRIKTTLMLMRRVWQVVCGFMCGVGIIMVLPGANRLGAWLYASAGLIGALVGIVIQPAVSDLLNALRLSAHQPFSLGDELIVGGFCGIVEEIAWDYIVLAADTGYRRIIPIDQLLSSTYETRARSINGVRGTITLWTDLCTNVNWWRSQIEFICNGPARTYWDGKVAELAVTECTASAKALTFTVSATDWPTLDTLKTAVLECLCDAMHPGRSHRPVASQDDAIWEQPMGVGMLYETETLATPASDMKIRAKKVDHAQETLSNTMPLERADIIWATGA